MIRVLPPPIRLLGVRYFKVSFRCLDLLWEWQIISEIDIIRIMESIPNGYENESKAEQQKKTEILLEKLRQYVADKAFPWQKLPDDLLLHTIGILTENEKLSPDQIKELKEAAEQKGLLMNSDERSQYYNFDTKTKRPKERGLSMTPNYHKIAVDILKLFPKDSASQGPENQIKAMTQEEVHKELGSHYRRRDINHAIRQMLQIGLLRKNDIVFSRGLVDIESVESRDSRYRHEKTTQE